MLNQIECYHVETNKKGKVKLRIRPMKLPQPTFYERKLSYKLASKNIPYKSGPPIWFTRANFYTPDFVIGEKLIVEVDGKIHSLNFRKTPDRIRQRALENLGYHVMRIRNDRIRRDINGVIAEIIQRYYETVDKQNGPPKIEPLNPAGYDSIPKYIQDKISDCAISFNQFLKDESWTPSFFRLHLPDYDPILVVNQSALERFMLLLLGLNINVDADGILNFCHSAEIFGKSIRIVRDIFGKQGENAGIHLKNMFNVSAPGFFKNLVFFGGPRINPGIVSIENLDSLRAHIVSFNRNFSQHNVRVEEDEVREECLYAFNNIKGANSSFRWLTEWNIA
jgi:very-short-patch-repair endonuclease